MATIEADSQEFGWEGEVFAVNPLFPCLGRMHWSRHTDGTRVWWAFRNENAPIRDDELATAALFRCLESAGPNGKDKCYRAATSGLFSCTKEHGSVSQRAGRRVAGLVLDERCVTEITSDGETNNEFCFSDDEKMRMMKEAESRFDSK